MSIDFAALGVDLLNRAPQLLADWLPGGHFEGNEYVALNPTRADHEPGSFSINARTGKWADFSSGEQGGHLTSLFAYLRGLTQVQAARDLIDTLGLNGAAKAGAHRNGNGRLPETRYKICDERGIVVAIHVRVDYYDTEGKPHKKIFWRAADGTSGLNGVKVTTLPLYLSEHLQAYLDQGADMIALVEGEKAADSLVRRGIAVVGTVTGAGKTPGDESLAPLLRFETIVLWPDADSKGLLHMQRIARALERMGHEGVRIVDWPEAPEGGDAADFDGGQDEVDGLIASAVKVENSQFDSQLDNHSNDFIVEKPPAPQPDQASKPPQKKNAREPIVAPEFSDDALGLRLVNDHRERIRFVADNKDWYMFDGAAWRSDQKHAVFDLARELCRVAAGEAMEGDKPKPGLAHTLASAKTRYSVTAQASIDQSIVMLFDEFDSDPLLLGTPGGVVDLRTGELRLAKPSDYISKLTAVAPAPPGTRAPRWENFLATTFPQRNDLAKPDTAIIEYVQRWAGYNLTGLTKEEKFLFHYGTGRNGKNTMVETWLGIVGDYGVELPAEVLMQRAFEPHRSELMPLRGARLIFVDEISTDAKWNQSRLMAISAGGKLRANAMRSDTVSFRVTGKLNILGNKQPSWSQHNVAAAARLMLLQYWMHFRGPDEAIEGDPARNKARNDDLKEILKEEWPAILRWMIQGAGKWLRDGLKQPTIVRDESLDSIQSKATICSSNGKRRNALT